MRDISLLNKKDDPQAGAILAHVDFQIESGDFALIHGASASGKTMLLQMMGLQKAPSSGLIRLFGQNPAMLDTPARNALKRRLGIIGPADDLLAELSIFENVFLPLRLRREQSANLVSNVIELLSWMELDHLAHAPPSLLCAGERQRAVIARAIVTRPEILLVDEPFFAHGHVLDARFFHNLLQLRDLGTAIILATRNRNLPEDLPCRFYSLQDGKLKAHARQNAS